MLEARFRSCGLIPGMKPLRKGPHREEKILRFSGSQGFHHGWPRRGSGSERPPERSPSGRGRWQEGEQTEGEGGARRGRDRQRALDSWTISGSRRLPLPGAPPAGEGACR